MRKGDLIWGAILAGLVAFLVVPSTHAAFMSFTTAHPFMGGFIKFSILATMGELLALRIVTGAWSIPKGIVYKAIIWGLLGMAIVLVFDIFGTGVKGSMAKGLLPWKGSSLGFAFLVSTVMNLTFAPTMMAFHRITDTYIDTKYENKGKKVTIKEVVAKIDWSGFVSFVLLKTVPIFWIPAHTITFVLTPEYRVLFAAMLSMALGAILAFSKKKSQGAKVQNRNQGSPVRA